MADVKLVETSLRDGNQSLWGATGIDTATTLAIASVMDRVGFEAIDFTTSTHMGVAVRYKREDPWERIRLMAAATPNTPLQFMSTGFRFISWDTASPEFMELAFATLVRNGISRFCLADPMNDVDAQIACARSVKRVGGRHVIAALGVQHQPHPRRRALRDQCGEAGSVSGCGIAVHQGPGRPAAAAARAHADSGDQGRDRIEAAGAAFPLHHWTGRAGLHGCAGLWRQRAAVRLGRRGRWHVESPFRPRDGEPARAGPSVWTWTTRRWRSVNAYFTTLADSEGLPAGAPQAFDAAYLRHQLPGGVVGTMRRHLREVRQSHIEAEVIAELGRVREELGWPIVMTPFAQMILTLAVMNVTAKDRYATIPDEVIRYAVGRFGRPNIPIDANVLDRIMSLPRTREILAEPGMMPLPELRKRIGRAPVGRGISAAGDHAREPGGRDAGRGARDPRLQALYPPRAGADPRTVQAA